MKKERACLNEIVIFDPYANEIVTKFPFHRPDRMLQPRKYFAGFFLHDTYYCHGGINTAGKVLHSFISIDLKTLEWKDVPYRKGTKLCLDSTSNHTCVDGGFPNFVHAHQMVVVTYSSREYVRLDALGEMDYGVERNYIRNEGVYMFGGITGETASESELLDTLYIMQIQKDASPIWREVETKGKPPEARFHHGMNYYPRGNMIVVYAGKRVHHMFTNDSEFVNEISVLRLDSLEWF